MAFVKDLWTKTIRTPDGKTQKTKSARHGRGKRWLAVWFDPDGNERSTAYDRKADAERKIATMGADIVRGDYIDPNAGKVLFGELAERWLASRIVDPATKIRYEYIHRLHVAPTFAKRQVKSIKPSHVQAWISDLSSRFGTSTCRRPSSYSRASSASRSPTRSSNAVPPSHPSSRYPSALRRRSPHGRMRESAP